MSPDTRIAYGARCTWWDSIDKVGTRDGLPCCPHCRNVLFEVPDEAAWYANVDRFAEHAKWPDYRQFLDWARGKCFPNTQAAKAAYEAEKATGA